MTFSTSPTQVAISLIYITSVFIGYIGTDSIGSLIKRFAAKKAGVEDGENCINQCKAFLDMLAWSEGTDNGRQKTRNHGYDVIVGGELFTDYSDHPRKLVTLNPKLKSTGAGRYQLLSWWDAYRKAWPERLLSEKSGRWGDWQQIKERTLTISIAEKPSAIDCCSNIWASLPGAGYGQSEHKGWQPDCKICKEALGGTVREIDVWARVTADYLRPGYLHHRLPVMGC